MKGEAVVRVEPLDGEWETLGSGRFRGIIPEGIEATSNEWGPDQLTFRIKREHGSPAFRSDLLPFSALEVEVDGALVWAGRSLARPSDEQDHSVQCEGWQYHLDDDVFQRTYVHTRLSDYVDARSFLIATLGSGNNNQYAGGQVQATDGDIVVTMPSGVAAPLGTRVGVVLDLGPDSTAKRAVVEWESSNNSAVVQFYCRGANSADISLPGDAAGLETFFLFAQTAASGTSSGTVTTSRRYVTLFLFNNSGGVLTPTADIFVRLKSVKIFRDTAYESGNASILEADEVIRDVLPLAPLLNQGTDLITDGTFAIPEYLTEGSQSPRQAIEAVNAYENYRHKIGGTGLRQLVYGPKPTAPLLTVGEWSGSEFSDASVDGEEIYSDVVVEATGADGTLVRQRRTQTGTLVDRRGFKRTKVLPIRTAVTSAVADRFGDLFLLEHRAAPFAGALQAKHGGVRTYLGGALVDPSALLLYAGEKVHLAHRIDPDTGAVGRDGRIAGVRYSHDARTALIEIDDRRDHLETVLSRYGLLVGG